MVIFDTTVLVLAFDSEAKAPHDPQTKKPLANCRDRIDYLVATLSKAGTAILIPTPALAEFLVKAGPNKEQFLELFTNSKNFQVSDFDVRAAIELAQCNDPDFKKQKKLDPIATRAKLKFDRQIVAIGLANRVERIYTGDEKLASWSVANQIPATMLWDLALPPTPPQIPLTLEGGG